MLTISRRSGAAGSLHALELAELLAASDAEVGSLPQPRLWHFDLDRPALVVGSRARGLRNQIDLAACERRGIEVVERRSGGGLVLLVPGSVVWIDLVVPAGHVGLPDDVIGSMEWFGERWREALEAQMPRLGRLEVHRGPERSTQWSSLICFAGFGPGEVLVDGRKLVGISQRRTREGVRFQSLAYQHHDQRDLLELLRVPISPSSLPAIGELGDAVSAESLGAALLESCSAAGLQVRSKTSSISPVPRRS
jgi:lipoate-protein ligase A